MSNTDRPLRCYTIYSKSIISDANIGFPLVRVSIFFETNVLAFVVDISRNMMCSKIRYDMFELFFVAYATCAKRRGHLVRSE